MLLLLVVYVRREYDAEQRRLALGSLQVENVVFVWVVVEQLYQVREHIVVAVMRRIMQHSPEEA